MSDDVKIGVRVEGADQAARDLQKVQSTTEAGGAAVDRKAAATRKAAGATRTAAKAQDRFNDSAKTALTGILGRLSPEMASLANIGVDMAKGIGQASVALLGMVGAGAALGGIVWAYRKIAEAAEKAAEAIKREARARLEAARGTSERQADMADTLESMAGLLGIAEKVTRQVDQMQKTRGIERDVASFGLMAQAIGGLTPEQVDQVMGAWLLTGRQARFEPGKKRANRQVVEQLLKVDEEAAARALAARRKDTGLKEMADAPGKGESLEQRIRATALEQLKTEHKGDLSAGEKVALEALAAGKEVPRILLQRQTPAPGEMDVPAWALVLQR